MTPTRLEIITYAQLLAGDPNGLMLVDNASPTAGQINIGLCFEGAYRELFTTYDYFQIPQAEFTFWTNLAADTSQLTPAQAGLTNFTEPVALAERDIAATVSVSSCNTASPIQVTTSTPHNLSAGTEVIVSGITGQTGANGRWFPTIIDASNFTLNGSTSVAAYVSGGVVTTSTDFYSPVIQATNVPQRALDGRLREYVWENGTFYFVGSNAARQLRLTFFASGSAPASGSVGIDDSKDFLSLRAAAAACAIIGNPRSTQLAADAMGFLNALITQGIREMQRKPVRQRAYRSGGYSRSANMNPSGVIF